MGKRVHDHLVVPLCADHHDELHRTGREELFWAVQGVDPIAWIEDRHK
jgi:hypothetical protein